MLLASLAARVRREPGDERGGTAWTSFLREVPVARRTSDVAAGQDVFTGCRLIECHPASLAPLQTGAMRIAQAGKLIEATRHCEPAVARDDDPPPF